MENFCNTVIPRFMSQLVSNKWRRKSNFILLILQSSMLLIRNLKKLNEFTVIPRYTSQLVPKKSEINRMVTQIEVRENKQFYDVNRNNVNRGYVNRRITIPHTQPYADPCVISSVVVSMI